MQDARDMADEEQTAPEGAEEKGAAKGRRKRALLIGAAAMALCGGGAFAAVSMGLVPGLGGSGAEAAEDHADAASGDHGEKASDGHAKGGDDGHGGKDGASGVAFVPVEPLTVTLGEGAGRMHLRFGSQLEVPAGRAEAVAALMPRIVDVLGGYLRALEPEMVSERNADTRLRAQMLRRVRLVVGDDAVDDLLVTEFVFN